MGIFNFLKDVGQKLMHTQSASFAPATDTGPSASSGKNDLSEQLQRYIETLGLGIESPKITVEGDKAILQGKTSSPEALEKAVLALGNTAGIAQVDTRVMHASEATPVELANTKFYTVKKGDTLSKIARETYGDANRYHEIFEANRPMLKNPDAIYPGQQLRITEATEKTAA